MGDLLGPVYIPSHAVSLAAGAFGALAVTIYEGGLPQSYDKFINLAHDLSRLENYGLGDAPTAQDIHKLSEKNQR